MFSFRPRPLTFVATTWLPSLKLNLVEARNLCYWQGWNLAPHVFWDSTNNVKNSNLAKLTPKMECFESMEFLRLQVDFVEKTTIPFWESLGICIFRRFMIHGNVYSFFLMGRIYHMANRPTWCVWKCLLVWGQFRFEAATYGSFQNLPLNRSNPVYATLVHTWQSRF